MNTQTQFPARPLLGEKSKDWTLFKGRLVDDETHASTVQFLLDHQRGTAAAFPNVGSRYHTIKKILPNTPREVEIMTMEALAPLINPRKITNVVATAETVTVGVQSYVKLVVSFSDAKGKVNPITKYLTVGRKR